MKYIIASALILMQTSTLSATELPNKQIINIFNISERVIEFWFNGEKIVIENDTGIAFPCLPDEIHSLQTAISTQNIRCGENKVLK